MERRLRLRGGATSASAHGTIRATVLIETIPAAFEMDEILYELRDHCAGLNAGRWDYIFSIIKNFRGRGPRFVLPDRSEVTMTVPFMRAYTELLVQTCHRRGAHAIGGMSAFIPNRRDPEVTGARLEQVAADKRREAADGFDGTWVAHPDLIPTARAEFDAVLGDRPNQLDRLRDDVPVHGRRSCSTSAQSVGQVTDAGVRDNVSIARPLHRVLAARRRRRGHRQPDGGRRDRRDLAARRSGSGSTRTSRRTRADRSPASGSSGLLDELLASLARTAERPLRRRRRGVPRRGAPRRVPDLPHRGGVHPPPGRPGVGARRPALLPAARRRKPPGILPGTDGERRCIQCSGRPATDTVESGV